MDATAMLNCYKTFQILTSTFWTYLVGGEQMLHGCQQLVDHPLNSRGMDFTRAKESHQKETCYIFWQVEKRNTLKDYIQ